MTDPSLNRSGQFQRGATLVELIVSIVVISIGLAGILIVMDRNTRASADPAIRHQAVAIAEAYLEEILLKDFCDPNNAVACTSGAPGSASCVVCPPAEANRADFDNVCDYAGPRTDVGARDQTDTLIPGLAGYTVRTDVFTNDALNALTGANCQVLRADVTVIPPSGSNIVLSGYRTNYR